MSAIAAQVAPRAGVLLERLAAMRPRRVLAALIAVEWLVTLGVALTVRHNGFLYYQGGDQLWHYVQAWLIGQGRLTHTSVGYAWSIVLLPFALIGGPNLMSPLPFIILLNVLVLMPVAMVATYGLAQRLGGRLFGYFAVAMWILVPVVGIKYADAGYHQRYTELLLPQSLGLSVMSDFPSMVAGVAAAYFTLRAAQDDAPWDGVLAGLLAGIAIGIKPSNAPLLVGMALALLVARRWRAIAYTGAALVPGVAALALWKGRGEGNLPLFHSALGTRFLTAHVAPVVAVSLHLGRYIHPSWTYFDTQLKDMEQHFWSVRLLEWIALAGAIGLLRVSRPAGLLFAGWFFSNVFAKWTTPGRGTIADSDLLRQSIPTIPAALFLIVGLFFLFPGMPQRLRRPEPRPWATHRIRVGLASAIVVLFAIVPAALAAGLPLLKNSDTLSYYTQSGPSLSAPFPVDTSWKLSVTHKGHTIDLKWPRIHPLGGTVDYAVMISEANQAVICDLTSGGAQCRLNGVILYPTHGTSYRDRRLPGIFTYHVLAKGSWINDPTAGDIYVSTPPVTVHVR